MVTHEELELNRPIYKGGLEPEEKKEFKNGKERTLALNYKCLSQQRLNDNTEALFVLHLL